MSAFAQYIKHKYGQEHIWEGNAKSLEPGFGIDGRADNAGSQTSSSFHTRHRGQGNSYTPDSIKSRAWRSHGFDGYLCKGALCAQSYIGK